MKLYSVCAEVTITVTCRVRAKSKAEAKRLAMELPLARPHRSNYWPGDEADATNEWSPGSELDGEPRIVEVEEIEG